MKFFTVIALLIAVFTVIFASQNLIGVEIHLFNLSYQASVGLIVILTFTAGVIMGLLISTPPMIGRMRKISSLKRRVEEQNRELEALKLSLAEPEPNLPYQP